MAANDKTREELSEPIHFESFEPIEVPVTIGTEEFVLVEATAGQARDWRANNISSLMMTEKKRGKRKETQSQFKEGVADSHLILVSYCLKRLDGGDRSPVTEKELSTWKDSIVEKLFERARAISGLEDPEEDEEDQDQKLKNE